MASFEIKKRKEKSDRGYLLPIRNITQQRAEAQCVILLAPYAAGQFGKRFEARGTVGTFLCQLVTMEINAKVKESVKGWGGG